MFPGVVNRSFRFFAASENFIRADENRSNRDETVGKVEHGKGPRRADMKQDEIDHMAIEETIDQVAECAGNDQRKTGMGDPAGRGVRTQSQVTKATMASRRPTIR